MNKTIAWVIVGAFGLLVAAKFFNTEPYSRGDASYAASPDVPPVAAGCAPSDISIKSMKAKFVDECRTTSCPYMKGVAVLTNGCSEPIGVQLKITAYDKAGAPVAARELWPASVKNIPPGDYTFSLDTWLDYDPEINTFEIAPVAVKRW